MEVLMYVGIFVASLAVLLKASDWFINSAEEIGLSFGVPPFLVGITIVAFGTSLPELATSIAAVLGGESEVVSGNVIGSNITNIALVLGLVVVLVKEINLENNIWHIDMPHLWGSAFLLWFVLRDQKVDMLENFILLFGLVIFLIYSVKSNPSEEGTVKYKAAPRSYLLLVVGGALVWLGADYTIFAIQHLSAIAGISPEIIALSAISLGTSLPEIIVSLNAARRGKTSIAVGNVIGSNIFNTYAVMGIPSFFGDLKIPDQIITFHLPLMIVMTILFGLMSNNKNINRWEGALLLLFYVLFFAELFKTIL
ncbi:MAG: calcium/sodium antiporter [Saprospiraceae bacterium]|nr:calcium/sodium antiporter [Lewinella sp.]